MLDWNNGAAETDEWERSKTTRHRGGTNGKRDARFEERAHADTERVTCSVTATFSSQHVSFLLVVG